MLKGTTSKVLPFLAGFNPSYFGYGISLSTITVNGFNSYKHCTCVPHSWILVFATEMYSRKITVLANCMSTDVNLNQNQNCNLNSLKSHVEFNF